jgi:transposase
MAKIADHLSIEELEERFRASKDAVEARHVQAIWLLAKGRTCAEVADLLAFVPRWVELLAARYNAAGPEALGDLRRRNGRAATILTTEVLAALAERLKRPPDDGGLWTGRKAAAVMAALLGVKDIHPQRGWDALKKLEWSIQVPRPRNPAAATEEEREVFKKNSPPQSPKRRRPTRISRSRSGRPTSIASA